jgi:hypothetical protein
MQKFRHFMDDARTIQQLVVQYHFSGEGSMGGSIVIKINIQHSTTPL